MQKKPHPANLSVEKKVDPFKFCRVRDSSYRLRHFNVPNKTRAEQVL
jgi:hypothetical protein